MKPHSQAVLKTPAKDPMHEVVAALEKSTGLSFCLKIFDGSLSRGTMLNGGKMQNLHLTPFCLRVKADRNMQCRECDLREVPALCQKKRRPFWHVCHAGATEWIIPVFVEERLAAVAYLGQFRHGSGGPSELPQLSRTDMKKVAGLVEMFGAYLRERIRTPRFEKETSTGYRRELIFAYLQRNLHKNPGIDDLAGHLGLSPTRTVHVVREATGSSFVELRNALRIERAKSLLNGTYYKIAHIAAECGFSSTHYFHRFFRQQTGMTPLDFRERHRPEV